MVQENHLERNGEFMNIHVHNNNEIPKDDTCYIVAKGGIYLKKKLDLIESITPIDKISFLEEIKTYAKLNIPKIELKIFKDIISFFRKVYELHKSESIVLVYYNKSKKRYKIIVPEQEVNISSLNYKSNITIKDHVLIGTIHSHASMSAFHSSTDIKDEENFDGLHITIGKIDKLDHFEISATVCVNGMRVPVLPEDYIDGIQATEFTSYFPAMFKPKYEIVNGEKIYSKNVKTNIGYIFDGYNCLEKIKCKSDWLKNVKYHEPKTYDSNFNFVTFTEGLPLYGTIDKNSKCKNKNDEIICENCMYRDEKLKLQKLKKIKSDELFNNFELDYMLW